MNVCSLLNPIMHLEAIFLLSQIIVSIMICKFQGIVLANLKFSRTIALCHVRLQYNITICSVRKEPLQSGGCMAARLEKSFD